VKLRPFALLRVTPCAAPAAHTLPSYRTSAPATSASSASVPATELTIFCRCLSSSKYVAPGPA
jgi:hypothetical protein